MDRARGHLDTVAHMHGRTIIVIGSGRTAPPIAAALAAVPGAHVFVSARSGPRADQAATTADGLSRSSVRSRPFMASSFADADVVVETVVEDLDVKTPLLSSVEAWLSDDALIATNTSSLSLESIAAGLRRPERFGGLHFLHPAHVTGVVEVVAAPTSELATLEALADLVRAMRKRPIVLRKATPGFLWNRLQAALLRECLQLLDDGIADVDDLDAAVSEGLAPRWLAAGPLATVDLGGPETFARVLAQLNPTLCGAPTVSPTLLALARRGGSFYGWGADRREAVERLRAQALEIGREFADRRHGLDAGPGSS